jgi:hypothetical protein
MKKMSPNSPRIFGSIIKIIALFTVTFGTSSLAEDVFVTSYRGTTASTDVTPCPPSCVTGASTFGASTTSASTATPIPVIPGSGRRVVYGNAAGATWSVTPTDINLTGTGSPPGGYNFTTLHNIGVYKIYVTKGEKGNASPDLIVNMTATGGSLADSNGVAATSIPLDVFQTSKPDDVWFHVGYITNDTLSPTITFTYASGTIGSTGGRWYMDAVRFESIDTCTGVANQVGVNGPLEAGQGFVNVTDVAEGATNVTVYSNGNMIGETNNSAGFASGTFVVSTSPLTKDESIVASQTKTGCTSLVPGVGPIVGGGPNPTISVSLAFWMNPSFQGPVGTTPTNSLVTNYFLKATGLIANFGTAPLGGQLLFSDQCWQTVTFDHLNDPGIFVSSGTTAFDNNPFSALEGLEFSISDLDSGPYEIYVDQIKNGDVVIEDFEGYQNGTTNTFVAPRQASSPSAAATYLGSPNSALISQNNAFDGTNSLRVQWQFVDNDNKRWAHVLANATTGKRYPQIDNTKPVTVRYLVLPVGQTTNKLHFATYPVNQTKTTNETATFSVTAAGEGPFTYQWSFEGGSIDGATDSSYTRSNVQLSDTGVYSVLVTGNNGAGCSASTDAKLTVTEFVPPPVISFSLSETNLTLNWTGSFNLQSKTNLSQATWNNVGVTTAPYTTAVTNAATFYRLQNP